MRQSCPDCDTPMESILYDSNASGDMLRVRDDEGFLGGISYANATNIEAYRCPDCARVLFYAPE